ncbi:MAG: tRNA pseudouridine(38-40) synthase TruA [Peptococcaceae bacterium]|jgi:tRNA pseudouridine38-40 synthase|nr:tRNA pseudouridine(38-40) synthase TruA [Peptococcaceae bacterium]
MEYQKYNIRLTLAYDGTAYHGFQRQAAEHGRTVQGTLEDTWRRLVGEEIKISTAGRTDAGVHACGQVINFRSSMRIPWDKLPKAFNSLLPRDIRIVAAMEAEPDFDARRSARWKRYDYCIDNQSIPDVLRRLYACHYPVPLQLDRMRQAAQALEGRHDFRAFAAAGGSSKTFTRTLHACRVERQAQQIRITCIGDGFLYNMVRIIAGTLLYAGAGKLAPQDIPHILVSGKRVRAGKTMPPHGLRLTYVHYGPEGPAEIFPEVYEG